MCGAFGPPCRSYPFIELDASDLDTMSDQLLAGLILHEIGHTLGFGIDPWTDHNLLQNPSLGVYNNRIVPAPDTHFLGNKRDCGLQRRGRDELHGARRCRWKTRLGVRAAGTSTGGSPCSTTNS